MKISEIQEGSKESLDAPVTFIVTAGAKNALYLIATTKSITMSELVREIVDAFLANNSEELKKLDSVGA